MSDRRTHVPESPTPAGVATAGAFLLLICAMGLGPNRLWAQIGERTPAVQPSGTVPAASPSGTIEAAAAEEELPTLEQMELPTVEQLLREPPVDWIVLKYKQQVIVAEPVTPRPDTLQKMQAAIEEKQKQRTRVSADELTKYRDELDALSKLKLRLPNQTDEADYLLRMNLVEQIIHHEDLVLRRIDALIGEEQFEPAFELLNILRRKTPDWPGALERHTALLWAEAGRKIGRGQHEAALATLTELHSHAPQYPGLAEQTGAVAERLIERAVAAEDWRAARHYLRRLETLFAGHATAQSWRSRLLERAEQQLAEAAQARSAGEHRRALAHAERAAAIWPSIPDLRTRYRVFADRYQVLHVGVLDLPPGRRSPSSQTGQHLNLSYAAERAERLREVRFFEVDHADDGSAHYSTRYCDWWEPLNLGRAVHFELRDSRQSWEMQPVVTAPEMARRIADRLDPAHPAYDERLAGYARTVEVHSPYSFTVHFSRVPVRIEPLLSIPVLEDDAVIEPDTGAEVTSLAGEDSPHQASQHVSFTETPARAGGFSLTEVTSDRAVYRRALPEPDDVRVRHVAEIQEHHYVDCDAALQGLLRGEVSMLVRPSAWIVDLLLADEEMLKSFFVAKMAVPVTHVVQFHPHSQPLKNREYRRALAYGIDREQILTETVLRSETSRLGRVVNGPFPSRSDAVNALVETREYDPLAAISLALAARKQLGGELPPLSMVVVDDPVAREAAERLVAAWSRIGIEVRLRDLPDGPLVGDETEPEWDLIYRTVQLTEPSVQLWPFLTLRERARVSDLDPFPDWLRQEIINLDLVTDWRDAVQSVNRLHLRLWGEVMLLPLWEVDEYLIYRKNVRGVPVRPVHPYEDVDRWIVEAWYPEPLP